MRVANLAAMIVILCNMPAISQGEVSDVHGAVTVKLHAIGVQIYQCKKTDHSALEWAFREPVAALIENGKSVGVHSAGPTWRMNDGSSIKGAVVKQAPGMASLDIPWLELKTTERLGEGMLSGVTGIRRVDTKGGNLSGPCSAEGSFAAVPYEAEYVFIKP